MEKYIIYITTNIINGKKYIGSHISNTLNDKYLGSGVILKKAIKKHGSSSFQREILAVVDDSEQMKELEMYYIEYYNAYLSDMFYNNTIHAAGITKCTWGPKISKAVMGHKWNEGKKHTEETKIKISKANTGVVFTQERKDKIGKSKLGNSYVLGNKLSKEVCLSISEAKTGHICYEDPERNRKIGEKNSKAILQFSLNGEFIQEYSSTTQAAKDLGRKSGNISQCLTNKTKSAYGYVWEFKNI